MILAFATINTPEGLKSELCIVPYTSDINSPPTPVRLLRPESSAVFHIGPKEAVTVNEGDEPGSIFVTAVPPSTLYITPDTPNRPGQKAFKIKLIASDRGYKTLYSKESGAQMIEWVANRMRE